MSKVDDFNGDGQVTAIASTILNPPSAWFADLPDGQKWDEVKCGPTSHYLCEYAVVTTDQTYYTTVTTLAGDALSYGSTAYALQVPGGVLIVTSPFQLSQDCAREGVPSNACSYPNFP